MSEPPGPTASRTPPTGPTPGRPRLLRALFDTALELEDPELREAFLLQACGDDEHLLTTLRDLLRAHGEAETFFPRDALPPPPPPTPPRAAEPPPSGASPSSETLEGNIGPYHLLRRLGEGGCGVVYLAEQHEPVRRQVALKVIRPGMDTERVLNRFSMESQALALMNHPHVAQVFEVGATSGGRPYFVMELVEGQTITAHCRALRLDLPQRLRLFIQVCLAIQHAHQKGILHRDIKPTNVLIAQRDGQPTPKVIDFGVAKAIAPQPPGGDDATRTDGFGLFIGTPAYMSPEQAEPGRADVDTRTDIYSLGALLFELLTDRPPFDPRRLREAGFDALRRILREEEPPPPSRLLRSLPPDELARLAADRRCPHGSALVNAIRGDLDWIVLRALEKAPARRYASASALALDVTRHLRDDPVEARPAGRLYRLRKLVRRNRLVFSAAFAVLLALLAGLALSTRLYFRERAALREQTTLRRQAETAERLTRAAFLTREGGFALAARLLDETPGPLTTPSLDGVVAYRAVGDWLARQRRWDEAARRYAVALELGRLDTWPPVTLDHQCYGVALLHSGDEAGYQRFRHDSIDRFTPATDSAAVARVLNTCLLRPLDPALRERLLPLGQRIDFWFSSLPPRLVAGWAPLTVGLWHYRLGDFAQARRLALLGDDPADRTGARVTTLRLIVALCDLREGRDTEARAALETLTRVTAAGFGGDFARGDNRGGYWYDWAFAQLLLQEAQTLAATRPVAPPANGAR